MNSANILVLSVLLLIQLITAKPQYVAYSGYGTYPYVSTQGVTTYNTVPVVQSQVPTFSHLSGATVIPAYAPLGYNTNTAYSSNGYYNNNNNGYATNPAILTNEANQLNG